MNERRYVAEFHRIRRQQNRDKFLSRIPTISKLTLNSGYVSGIGDKKLSRPAQILSPNYHQYRTCINSFKKKVVEITVFLRDIH